MLVLTEPSSSGAAAGVRLGPSTARERPRPRSGRRAACRCRAPRRSRCRAGCSPASRSACADHRLLRRPVGRRQPVAAPVLVDRRAADHREDRGRRRASASASRLSTTTPQPSPRTKPSAAASKVLQRPSAASIRACEKRDRRPRATRIRFTPPASARSHSPARRLWQARCTPPATTSRRCRRRRSAPAGRSSTTAGRRRRCARCPVPV